MSIIQWNCRGVKPNYEEIKSLLCDHCPIAVCLQETFLKDTDKITFKGYDMYSVTSVSPRDGRAIGGSAILVKKGIPHKRITLNTNLQAVAVNISLHKMINFCSIYIPPSHTVTNHELDNLFNQLPSPTVLLGDFNAHNDIWGCSDINGSGQVVEDFIGRHGLCLLNDKSNTYLHPASGSFSAIDLTLCSPTVLMDFEWSVGKDQCGSDHFPIFVNIRSPDIQNPNPKWLLHKADWSRFQDLCAENINREILENGSDLISSFATSLTEVAMETIPKSSTNSKHVHKPWFNEECKAAVRQRKKTLDRFKVSPTHANLASYKRARAHARHVIKESKRNSWRQYVSRLNSRSSIKKTWDMVRKISGKEYCSTSSHLNKPDGTRATDIKDIANTLADAFQTNSSTENYSDKFKRFKEVKERKPHNFHSNNQESYNDLFSLSELKDALHKANNTAVGPDDVHYQLLKHLPDISLNVLLDILNNIWVDGDFPDSWRQATVIPIPKPGKDATNPINYRPIALTSCICKTMERMINARLVWFLERNNLITKFQSGFRKQRSTTDQLVRFESLIRDAFIKGEHVVSVFFDLEKAYDTTWKYGILEDLFNMGLRGRMPVFIKNFLSDRTFNVRLGSIMSDLHDQEMGVPQGSILSPTLFNIKMNSIVKVLKPGVDCSLYVDDFVVCYKSKNMQTIERQLQLCLNRLQKWADENGFRFSKTKTVCMHFCNKRKLHPDPSLDLGGTPIPVVEQTKFLGLIFDRKLSFKPHIEHLRAKCFKALNLLKVVSNLDWGADRKVLLRLYRAVVRSKLDYGCIVYGSARKSYLKRLETIQNQSLRLCLGAFRTSPVASLHVEADELPMELRREKLALQYALKLSANPSNPAYNVTFKPKNTLLYERKPNAIPSFGIRIKEALNKVCPDENQICLYKLSAIPPWRLCNPDVNLSLSQDKKGSIDPILFQSKFLELKENFNNHEEVYTDGSKDGDRVAAAAVSDDFVLQVRLPDKSSIFTAELKAILMALVLIEESEEVNFVVFSDSMSSLMALKGSSLDNPMVLKIREKYSHLVQHGKLISFVWIPSHVGIRGNEEADKAAKDALKLQVSNLKIPFTDFKSEIRKHVKEVWQEQWDSCVLNKLHSIHPQLGLWPYSTRQFRREEAVLARIRIGHTYITHSFLLKGDPIPQCIPCQCPLNVKHILIECHDFAHIRNRYFNVNSMGDLFKNVDPSKILKFIKDIGLFYKL